MRGTFANIRLRNQLAPGTEGGWTTYQPDGEVMTIYDAAMKYKDAGVPLVVFAGKEYGSGSSRDWAAKGTLLLGVKAVIAESFERIHRSNLVNMGVLPLHVPGWCVRRVARTDRPRTLRDRGDCGRPPAEGHVDGPGGRRGRPRRRSSMPWSALIRRRNSSHSATAGSSRTSCGSSSGSRRRRRLITKDEGTKHTKSANLKRNGASWLRVLRAFVMSRRWIN